jgi:hypothetical protein
MRRRDEDGERSTEAEASGWNARARWPGLESRGAATACTRAAAIGAGDGRSVGQRGGPSGREGGGRRWRLGRAAEWERRWRCRCWTAPTREMGSFVGFLRGFSPLSFLVLGSKGVRGIRERGGAGRFCRGSFHFSARSSTF